MSDTTEPFGLVVRFTLRPGREREFDSLMAQTVPQIAEHEPGTLIYACHSDRNEEPPARIFYELYADRSAFDAHEQQPHVRRFLAAREELVEQTEVTFLRLDTAAGLAKTPGTDSHG